MGLPLRPAPIMITTRDFETALADRYAIRREIGSGGTAHVYLADDLKHGRAVALKILRAELAPTLVAERFLREIQLAAQLSHPHILPVYDSGEAAGRLYYVMPYVAGESLRERLRRNGPLPIEEARQLAREVASALAFAHAAGVVHRDIKPENILLSGGHAVVADFGIARALEAAGAESLTHGGIVVGTPAYMSPEQATGDYPVDGRSDVYSLGCVLYEMLAGVPPFEGRTVQAVLTAHLTDAPPRLRALRREVPRALEGTVARALAKVPGDRFASAAELADVLVTGAFRRDSLDLPRAVQSRWRARFPGASGRRRWWMAAGAAAALVLLSTLAVSPLHREPPLDATRLMVLPFQHEGAESGDAPLVKGEECRLLLHDALSRWSGLSLIGTLQVNDVRARMPAGPLTLDRGLAMARQLRAGRLAWGTVRDRGDSLEIRAAIVDVNSGEPVREHRVRIARDLGNLSARFSELADSLLVGAPAVRIAAGGAAGTRSLAAWRAYEQGHEALARWALPAAAAAFADAVANDPSYAHAHLWLAQTRTWSGDPPSSWREAAARAVGGLRLLGARDRRAAAALLALADGRFPDACAEYEALVARDSSDFAAWFGLGDCRARDRAVVPDSRSPSGWRFRGSQHAATLAYLQALRGTPSSHAAFGEQVMSRVGRLLYLDPNRMRSGTAVAPDSGRFGAFASLKNDTIAFIPYPIADVIAGAPGTLPPSNAAAIERARRQLAELTASWVRAFPRSAAAWEARAAALEGTGQREPTAEEPGALDAIRRARALATADAGIRLGALHVRLLLESGRFADARALADSLVRRDRPGNDETVAALAALMGRAHVAARVLRGSAGSWTAYGQDGRPLRVAPPVADAALALLAYASVGAPAESIAVLEARAERLVRQWTPAESRPSLLAGLLDVPRYMAVPVRGLRTAAQPGAGGSWVRELQAGLARGDTATVRRRMRELAAYRGSSQLGALSPLAAYHEGWLLATMGDTAAAIERLDVTLGALPGLVPYVVTVVPEAASLWRAMVLRAELASRTGDAASARRWATSAAELLAGGDPALDPIVARMRALARP